MPASNATFLGEIAGIARDIPELDVDHEEGAELLILGWGSSYGAIRAAVRWAGPGDTIVIADQTRFVSEVKADDLYCSGFVRRAAVPTDLKVISKFNSCPPRQISIVIPSWRRFLASAY